LSLYKTSAFTQCFIQKIYEKSHGGPDGEKKRKEKKRRKEGETASEIKESSNIHLWVEKKLYGPGRNWP